jgi:hypothetical protein
MKYHVVAALGAAAGLLAGHNAVAQEAPGSAIHGSLDETISNAYITPRGLLESYKGLTSFTTVGLGTSVYSGDGFAKDVSVHVGALFNLYSQPNASTSGIFRELDWWGGTNLTLQDGIVLGVEFSQFVSPKAAYTTDSNIEFSVVVPPITVTPAFSISPYAKLFWNAAGASVTVTGKEGQFDVELGLHPVYDLTGQGIPLTLSFPTWVTVGPSDFWGGGGGFGVFTTGVSAKTPLSFIPTRYGVWYADAGAQYYHLINSELLVAQTDLGVHQQRDVFAGTFGIGFGF